MRIMAKELRLSGRCWHILIGFAADTAILQAQSPDSHAKKPSKLLPTPHLPSGIVQSAAGPHVLIVIVAPAQEGQCRLEGRRQPYEEHQGDGRVPIQSVACVGHRKEDGGGEAGWRE